MTSGYDIAFLGHYTKDTIVSSSGVRVVNGGAFNYGSHVAARMGLRVAAITRLAQEDMGVADELKGMGVDTFVRTTGHSTCLRLVYPTCNVDERVIYITSSAGAFTPKEVTGIQAGAFVVGASLRGEVSLRVIEEIAKKDTRIAIDAQGFVRVNSDGKLVAEPWAEKQAVLAHVDILKADAVEAELLTGETNVHVAARMLAELGPSEIVLTHRDGLLVLAEGRYHEAGFFPTQLVGRSGRGDTCIASYVCSRLTRSPAESTIWAAAVTSLKMEAEGPFRRSIREVENLIQTRYAS